jgi:hypothetical protein
MIINFFQSAFGIALVMRFGDGELLFIFEAITSMIEA